MITLNKLFNWQLHTVLVAVLLILNLVDYHTTTLILDFGGTEANPIMNHVIFITGALWPILAIKMGIMGVIWWGYELVVEVSAYLYTILGMTIAAYTGVVARSVKFCLEYGLL